MNKDATKVFYEHFGYYNSQEIFKFRLTNVH